MPQINGAKPYIMYFMLELRLQFQGKGTDLDLKGVPNWGIGITGYWDIVTVKIYILSWGLRRYSIAHYMTVAWRKSAAVEVLPPQPE